MKCAPLLRRASVMTCAMTMTALAFGCSQDDVSDANYVPVYDAYSGHHDSSSYAFDASPEQGGPPTTPSGDNFIEYVENDFIDTSEDNLATFSVDVDTASYTIMRSDISRQQLPAESSVRVEEYINYFRYDYEAPELDAEIPFAIHTELAPSEFGEGLELLRVGIQGAQVAADERKPANLVFLIDVSGSMGASGKLQLAQWSLARLVETLSPDDTLGIVVYAGREAVLLEPTAVSNKSEIIEAIDSLTAGGSTAGQAGITQAYQMARAAFREDGINRVVLCTDGDFNVGLTNGRLLDYLDEQARDGIAISVLGFGRGNLNDGLIERIADRGDGNYAFIDTQNEALRVLSENVVSTLQVIAKDVKIQVDFNDELVERYRLVGYDNRVLEDDDFSDDSVDAAEIGAGHNVTALLELELTDAGLAASGDVELATVSVRFKFPNGTTSTQTDRVVLASDRQQSFDAASDAFRLAAAVAEFAEVLRGSKHSEGERLNDVLSIVQATALTDAAAIGEFETLVESAAGLLGIATD